MRTPAASVICGTGVGRSVGAGVAGRAVAVGAAGDVDGRALAALEIAAVAEGRAVGAAVVGAGLGVGGTVGASVRNGSVGAGVGSGSGSVICGFSATGGCSGAFAFLGCASV